MAAEGTRVVVIGAGIAGLVATKVLRDDGFDVTILEKESSLGGVWAVSRTYPGLRSNNSRNTYAYSDHPYDRSADMFPTAAQVREYLGSYAARFGIEPLMRLSTRVDRVTRDDRGFEVTVEGPDGPDALRCDFVVVATGTYSEPSVPDIAGAQDFSGTIVHSSRFLDPELAAGKRVIVVGAGKSALDCAAAAAEHAGECTLVFRAPHWMFPRYLFRWVPADAVVLGRITEMLIPYPGPTRAERFLHGPGRGLTLLIWRAIGLLIRAALRTPPALIPDESLPHGIENLGFVSEFYDLARQGRIGLRRTEIARFGPGTEVRCADGTRLEADVVVFATGWRQEFAFLAPDLHAAVRHDGRLRLFRHILPPTEPRLGFIGYASSTACQLTSEISAHWLSQHFRGELPLPPVVDMDAEIDRVHAWLAEVLPARPEGYFIGTQLMHHLDDLLTDMALPPHSTFRDYLARFSPARYRSVAEQRRRARAGG